MKNSIKYEIIKFLEANPLFSKSGIENHMKGIQGTTGDCVGRRLRELCAEGKIERVARVYEDKKYLAYRVAEVRIPVIGTIDSRTEEVNQTNLKI